MVMDFWFSQNDLLNQIDGYIVFQPMYREQIVNIIVILQVCASCISLFTENQS